MLEIIIFLYCVASAYCFIRTWFVKPEERTQDIIMGYLFLILAQLNVIMLTIR